MGKVKQITFFGDDDDERKPRKKRAKKRNHEKEFRRFHLAHPDVFEQIIKHARLLWSHGHRHYGIAAFFENFRWHRRIPEKPDEAEEFKLNNNYRAFYARMLMALYPEFDGFFELRERHRRRNSTGISMGGNPWIDGPEIEDTLP